MSSFGACRKDGGCAAAAFAASVPLLFCTLLLTAGLRAQAKPQPLKESEVIELLKNDVSSPQVESVARQFGIAFSMTPEAEERLRRAGASDELLSFLRKLASKPVSLPGIVILSTPGHTQVYVDDVFDGETSEEGLLKVPNLTPGKHRIRLSHEGYPDLVKTLDLADGQMAHLDVTLEKTKPAPAVAPTSPPRPTASQPVRMDAKTEAARLISDPKPEYPLLARMAHVQGEVKFHALIGKDGSVDELKLLSGNPLLVGPAMQAVKNWRYQPTLLKGQPVEVATEIDVGFVLAQAGKVKVYNVGGDVSPPRPVYAPNPPYTDAARNAKIHGTVVLAIVIGPLGLVRQVRVIQSLDKGLDEQAVRTVRTWRFRPAVRKGIPVPVRIRVDANFQLVN